MRFIVSLTFILSMAVLACAGPKIGDVLITVSAKKRTTFYVPERVVKVDFLNGKKPGLYIDLSGYIKHYNIYFFIDDSSHLAKFYYAPECLLKDPDYENVDQCALKYIKKNRELFLRKCTRVNGPVPDESYKEIVDFVKKEYPHFYLNDRCSSDSEYGIGLIFRSPNGESYTFDATSCKKIGETFKQDPIVKPVYEVLNTIFGIVDKDVGECECKCHRK